MEGYEYHLLQQGKVRDIIFPGTQSYIPDEPLDSLPGHIISQVRLAISYATDKLRHEVITWAFDSGFADFTDSR